MSAKVLAEPLTPEWFEARKTHLGGTDIARIMTGDCIGVYADKIGATPLFEGNLDTEEGRIFEQPIARAYCLRSGLPWSAITMPVPMLESLDLPCLSATPDALIDPAQTISIAQGVEIKRTKSRTVAEQLGEDGSDWIPNKWYWQVHTQLTVAGWTGADLAAEVWGRVRIFTVPRDEVICQIILDTAAKFWRRIEARNPPDPCWELDNVTPSIQAVYPIKEGLAVTLDDPATLALVEKYQSLGQSASDAEKERKILKGKIILAMNGAERGLLPDGRVLHRQKISKGAYTVQDSTYEQLVFRKK